MKRLRLSAVLVLVLAGLVAVPAVAEPLLVAHPHGRSLAARERSQRANLAHVRYVCRHGRRASQRRSCAAVVWLRRELGETVAARAAQRAPASGGVPAVASWYGPGFYGHGMACGGVLETSTIGVANRSLACGTRLVVCFGGRCSRASVVDRGPYVSGRDFDLTGALAWRLHFGGVGVITYRLL